MAITVFEEYLKTFLVGMAEMQLTFTGGIWAGRVPQKETRPAVSFHMPKRKRANILAGQTGKEERLYCFNVFDQNYTYAKRNAELLIVVLDQQKLTIGPFTVVSFLDEQSDDYEHESQLFRVQTDFNFTLMNYPS